MSSAAPLPHDVTTTKSRNKSKITNNESLLFAMIAQNASKLAASTMKEGEVKEESASSIPRILQSAQAQQLAESATTRRIGMRTKKISARLLQATAAAVATTTAHRNGSWSTDNEKACHNHQNNATVENSDDGSESLHHRVNAASQASINNNDDAVFRTAVRAGPKPPVLFARTPALQRTRTKQGSSSSTGAASRGSHSRRTTPATQDSTLTRKEESIFSKCRRTAKPAVKKKKEAIAAPAKRKRTTAVSFFSSNMLQQDAEEESKSTCTMNLLYPEKEKRFLLSNKKVKAAATDLRTRVAAQTLVQLAKGSLCRRSQQQQNQLVISFDTLATAAVHNVQLSPPNDYETPTTSESSVCLSEPGSQQLACSSHQYNAPLPTMIAATLPAALSSLSIDAPTSLEPHTLPSIGTASAPSTTVRNVNDLDVTSANGTSAEVSVEQGDGYREVIQQHQPVTMERCTSSRLPSTSSVTILSTMSRKDVASNGSIPLSDALVATDSGLAMVRSEPTPMSSSLSCHLEGDAVATEDDFACIHTELPDELLELPGELTCAASRTAINFLEQAIHFLEQADRAAWVDREEKDLNASSSAELVEPAGRHMEAAEYCVATADDEKSEQESKSAVGEAPDASTVSSGRVAPDNNVAFTVQNPTAKVNSKEAAVMRTCNFDTESGETLSRSKIIALTLVVEKESNEGGLVKCDRVMTKYPAVTAVNIDSRVAESGPLEVTSNDILEASGHVPLTSMTEQNDDLTAVTTMESDEADENEIPCSQAALSNKLLTKPDIASSPTCFVMAFLHSSEPNDELQALTPSCSVDVAVPETVVSEHGVPVTARPGPPSTENDASHNHFESKQMVSVKIPSSAGFFLAEAAEQVQSTSMETVFREGMNHVMEQFVDDTAANLTDVSSIGSEVDDALQPSLSRKKRRLETLPKEGNDITLKDSASCPGMRTARSEPKQWIKFPIGTKVVKYFAGYDTPFKGQVIRHDTESGYYLVRYEDEDQEECDEKELADIAVLQNKEQSPVPRPDLSLTVRETLCLFKLHGLAKDCYQKIVGFKAVDKIRVADFFLFMSERQRVWERRNRGDQEPWSASPVFQRYSWCNNYRELDRGTQFFRATVLEMLDDNCDANLREWTRKVLFASYVYRQVNRLESFVETGFPDEFKLAKYFNKVKKLKERGERFFSAAHQTTNFSKFEQFLKQATAKNSKMLEKVCDAISNAEGSKDCIEALQKLPGVGTFFAWQILCDLQESRCVHFEDGYSLLGPGAKCGLENIFSKSTMRPLEQAQQLADVHGFVYDALGIRFSYWRDKALTVKEIEHALCEYGKYCKIAKAMKMKGVAVKGQRLYTSRSDLDIDKPCKICCALPLHDNSVMCDTCNTCFCTQCVGPVSESVVSWICHRCKALEGAHFS